MCIVCSVVVAVLRPFTPNSQLTLTLGFFGLNHEQSAAAVQADGGGASPSPKTLPSQSVRS